MDYRYKLTISYDGTCYNGFQKQLNSTQTIEYYLEKALTEINKENVTVYASGRTDSKVHALNQVCHVDLGVLIECVNLKRALNSLLPGDIYVKSVERVDESFHARFSNHIKTYKYVVALGEYDPLNYTKAYYYPYKLTNIDLIEDCLNVFIGTHNFKAYCKEKKEEVPSDYYIRTITSFTYELSNDYLSFYISSKGFMHNQVRKIIGMILEVLRGKLKVEDLNKYLDNPETSANKLASGSGLYLYKVDYLD